ncbi:DUF443 family protein [Salipaludibacillus neizhouensis]
MRLYYCKRNKEKMNKIITRNQLKSEKLVIRPNNLIYFLKFSLMYMFVMVMGAVCIAGFISIGNVIMLLLAIVFFLFILVFNTVTVMPGQAYGKLANPK